MARRRHAEVTASPASIRATRAGAATSALSALHPVLGLQRAAGNQAVQRFIAWHGPATPVAVPRMSALAAPPSSRRAVQRRGGDTHAGCSCADASTAESVTPSGLAVQLAPAPPAGTATAPGEVGPLTSPRFAGDPILEACHQNRARLREGDRGASVEKIQQALVDLGYDLGTTGVDRVYGAKTAAAIRSFKANEQLGSEQFGDVGPGTMKRLDHLFQEKRAPNGGPVDLSPGTAEEGDDASCPAPDRVASALAANPTLAANATKQVNAPAPNTVGAPGGGSVGAPGAGTHISVYEAVRRFGQKIDAKAAVTSGAPDANVSSNGQFFIETAIRMDMTTDFAFLQVSGEGPTGVKDDDKFQTLANELIQNVVANTGADGKILGQLDALAKGTTSPNKQMMLDLLKDTGKTTGGEIDAELFAAFDASTNDAIPPALLKKHRSLRAWRLVFKFDGQACATDAKRVAARIKAKGGLTPRQKNVPPLSIVLAAGGGTEDMRPMRSPNSFSEPGATSGIDPKSDMVFGDVVDQSGVGSAVSQMQKVIDAGGTIHARVLSGLGYGENSTATGKITADIKAKRVAIGPPKAEHSILIIGYDGNSFVFHDSDANQSHTLGAGFGMLYVSDGRLSTASSAFDLVVFNDGKHRRGDKRYQVISLTGL